MIPSPAGKILLRLPASLLWVGALCVVLTGNGCESGPTGGSETTNGLAGLIRTQDGRPAAYAQVKLVPEGFIPVSGADTRTPLETATDAAGKYRFGEVASGGYSLEAKDSQSRKLLVSGVNIPTRRSDVAADGTLKATGTLRIPFSGRHLPENTILYVPGTTFSASIVGKIDQDEFLILPGLAEGDYPVLMAWFPDTSDGGPIVVAEGFHIGAGETTDFTSFQAWSHSRTLRFDLSASGAVPDSLVAYPLLVRLDAGNFDFSQTGEEGRDLRFALRDGSPAAFQIDSWDALGKTAAIWVRVESPVAGPDSLTLYWGRRDAAKVSDGKRVFAATLGFAAVWHLGETANTAAGGYRDAGAGELHATASEPNGASDTTAVIGKGKLFAEGVGQLAAPFPAGMGGNAGFTVSFWLDFRMAPFREAILTLGEESPKRGFHFLIRADTTAQFGPWDSSGVVPSLQNGFNLAPFLGRWIHIATVYDPAAGILKTYVNGNPVAENALTGLDLQVGYGVSLGKKVKRGSNNPSESDLNGALDEVRLYNRVLPESYILWEYATQRENAQVVKLE